MRDGYVTIKDATGAEYTINQDRIYHLVKFPDAPTALEVRGFGLTIILSFGTEEERDRAFDRLIA